MDLKIDTIDLKIDDKRDSVATLQSKSAKIVNDNKIYLKFLDRQHNRVESIKELLSLPVENEQIRIITQKSFNSFAILRYILDFGQIDECYLTTYNIDKNTIKGLREIVDNSDIDKLTILVSESINYRMPERAEELKRIAGDNISVILAWNHTKILLCKQRECYYVVEGSGNLSSNARIEQYLFEESKQMYEFHRKWIDNVQDFSHKDFSRIN